MKSEGSPQPEAFQRQASPPLGQPRGVIEHRLGSPSLPFESPLLARPRVSYPYQYEYSGSPNYVPEANINYGYPPRSPGRPPSLMEAYRETYMSYTDRLRESRKAEDEKIIEHARKTQEMKDMQLENMQALEKKQHKKEFPSTEGLSIKRSSDDAEDMRPVKRHATSSALRKDSLNDVRSQYFVSSGVKTKREHRQPSLMKRVKTNETLWESLQEHRDAAAVHFVQDGGNAKMGIHDASVNEEDYDLYGASPPPPQRKIAVAKGASKRRTLPWKRLGASQYSTVPMDQDSTSNADSSLGGNGLLIPKSEARGVSVDLDTPVVRRAISVDLDRHDTEDQMSGDYYPSAAREESPFSDEDEFNELYASPPAPIHPAAPYDTQDTDSVTITEEAPELVPEEDFRADRQLSQVNSSAENSGLPIWSMQDQLFSNSQDTDSVTLSEATLVPTIEVEAYEPANNLSDTSSVADMVPCHELMEVMIETNRSIKRVKENTREMHSAVLKHNDETTTTVNKLRIQVNGHSSDIVENRGEIAANTMHLERVEERLQSLTSQANIQGRDNQALLQRHTEQIDTQSRETEILVDRVNKLEYVSTQYNMTNLVGRIATLENEVEEGRRYASLKIEALERGAEESMNTVVQLEKEVERLRNAIIRLERDALRKEVEELRQSRA